MSTRTDTLFPYPQLFRSLSWGRNPDILAGLAKSASRPRLLIGFAAETENVVEPASAKRVRKGCDWIVANDVSGDVMGGDSNTVHLITGEGTESWERAPTEEGARRLAARIADETGGSSGTESWLAPLVELV